MSVIADRLRAAANAAEEVVGERDALLKVRAELLSERDTFRRERDEARTYGEQCSREMVALREGLAARTRDAEAWEAETLRVRRQRDEAGRDSIRLAEEAVQLGDKLREWAGTISSVSATEAAEILRDQRDHARSERDTARSERNEARADLSEQIEISTRLHHEMTALSGKLAQWTGTNYGVYTLLELADILRQQRDAAQEEAHQLRLIVGAKSPFASVDVTLAELQGELDRAKAAIPCANCGQVGGVREHQDGEPEDNCTVWLCVDSKACNTRAAAGRTIGPADVQPKLEVGYLRKELAILREQVATLGSVADQAAEDERALRKQVDTLAAENLRLLGELHTERDNREVEFDDAARNSATLLAEVANRDKTIDVLAKKNADLAAELERRPSERFVRNLTMENARLRSKLGDPQHAALTWVPTHVADVVQAALAWFHSTGKDSAGAKLSAALVAYEATKADSAAVWAHVEIMGHREHYGRIILVGDAESGTLRRVEELDGTVHYYGPGAIFAIHPCSEAEVRKQTADPWAPAQPVPVADEEVPF